MTNPLSDTFIHAVPDLTLMVRSDGVILKRLGGRDIVNRDVHGQDMPARTLDQMWSPDVAKRLRQLVRHALKGRTALDRKYRDADRWYEVRLRPHGIERVLMVFRELPDDHDSTDCSTRPALRDPLETRGQLLQRLSQAAHEARLSERPLALVTVHLGGLTDIEQAFDGTIAEQLTAAAAERLHPFISQELSAASASPLALIADHVLAAVIEQAPARDVLRTLMQRMCETLLQRFDLAGRSIRITPACGIAMAPEDGVDAQQLLDRARSAMCEAHRCGRIIVFHSDSLRLRALSRLDGEHELRWALERDQFHLQYRPVREISTGDLLAVRAQPCWMHPVRGRVAAEEFITLMETSQIAPEIGRWMLSRACADLCSTRSASSLRVAVDLCQRHASAATMLDDVTRAIAATGIAPRRLALQIIERSLNCQDDLLQQLHELREAGVQVIIQRFGIGHVAMDRLAALPVDIASLDPTLLRDLEDNSHRRKVCRSTIDIAHALGWKVAAETVTNSTQLTVLQELGCDFAGGELFGASRELHQLLAAGPPGVI